MVAHLDHGVSGELGGWLASRRVEWFSGGEEKRWLREERVCGHGDHTVRPADPG